MFRFGFEATTSFLDDNGLTHHRPSSRSLRRPNDFSGSMLRTRRARDRSASQSTSHLPASAPLSTLLSDATNQGA